MDPFNTTESDKRINRNVGPIFYTVIFIALVLAVGSSDFLFNEVGNPKSDYSTIALGFIFIYMLFLILPVTNNIFEQAEVEAKAELEVKSKKISPVLTFIFIIKESFVIILCILITAIMMTLSVFNNKPILMIIFSFGLGLLLLLISYKIERCKFGAMYNFRLLLESKFNISNIINVFTAITTIALFLLQNRSEDSFVWQFAIIMVVYIYFIFYNIITFKKSEA